MGRTEAEAAAELGIKDKTLRERLREAGTVPRGPPVPRPLFVEPTSRACVRPRSRCLRQPWGYREELGRVNVSCAFARPSSRALIALIHVQCASWRLIHDMRDGHQG